MIIPAILENNSESFHHRLSQLSTLTGLAKVQVDFIDGIFVRGRNLAIEQLPDLDQRYEWEAHLMVQSPQNFFNYHEKGFKKIIIHYEAYTNLEEILLAIQAIKDVHCIPAIALNPETPMLYLKNLSSDVNHYTVMSVTPGRQGSTFVPATYERVRQLKMILPKAIIEVDGAVSDDNIALLSEAGAEEFAVGSFIFANGNPQDNYARLQKALTW